MLFPRDPGKVDARSSDRTIVRLEGSRVRISKLADKSRIKSGCPILTADSRIAIVEFLRRN
jgi:hypothetical protein